MTIDLWVNRVNNPTSGKMEGMEFNMIDPFVLFSWQNPPAFVQLGSCFQADPLPGQWALQW